MSATSSIATGDNLREEFQRLSGQVRDLTALLRAQREALRQRGMSLPAGVLSALKSVHAELESMTQEVAASECDLEELRALAETTALINSTLGLEEALDSVMDTVIQLTGAERGYIVLRDGQSGEMEFRVARNLDQESMDEGDLIVSRSIVARVAESGEAVVTTNAQEDARFRAEESVVGFSLRSILCVPLKVRGETIGVAYADNRIRAGLFGSKELELVKAFANQAAVAIHNARLFERLHRSLAEIMGLKELLDNVFASIASGVITTDEEGIVTMCNRAAGAILGVGSEESVGVPLEQMLLVERGGERLLGAEGKGGTVEVAVRIPTRGVTSLNMRLSPLRDAEQVTQGVAIVMDDLTELRKREAQLAAVRRYLPPAMVDNIQSIEGLALSGVRCEITVLFVNVCPFESLFHYTDAKDYMAALNRYFTLATDAMHEQEGIIDKYMGSEVMGLFNTQLNPAPDHACRAVRAALNMARGFADLQRELGQDPSQAYYRVGIHSGIATVGNVGSPTRREFTAIGDSVNLAKRLEQNAALGQIFISEDTRRLCQPHLDSQAGSIEVVERGAIQLKGRQQLTQVYEVCYR
jgi:adenylate cyclase